MIFLPGSRPVDAVDLVRELYRQGKLTKYQAQSLYHGRSKGLVLGNYVILDRIGHGGMGQVFKAQHRRMQRIVALKVLPPDLMQSQAVVQRFEREVQAVARLSHPNIVTAYDADEATGIHFLVMECVDGENLATLVRHSGPFPRKKHWLAFFRQPGASNMPISRASFIATLNRRICCWTKRASSKSLTWGWRGSRRR